MFTPDLTPDPLFAIGWLDTARDWLLKPEIRDNIILTVLGAALIAFFFWLTRKLEGASLAAGAGLFQMIRRARDPLAVRLDEYRAELDRWSFEFRHSWMKEGQTLGDILVPVAIDSDALGGIEDWSIVLAHYFGGDKPSSATRLAVIGGPGSGKSVALKAAARRAWSLPTADKRATLIPVFLTFADYRQAEFDLVQAVANSLRLRGFRPNQTGADGDETGQFARTCLDAGRLMVIVDGLDELKLEDRNQAAKSLTADLNRFSTVPAIISCRKAAWGNQFAGMPHKSIEMADFTPAAVRQFVRQWSFTPPKTADELIHTITSQPHIGELARTPLMLTIIAFLYSQPKYHLPENRALFYDVCTRALLEEWDQAATSDQANRFERHHKEYVLGELAFQHLNGPTPDADLDERTTLETIADVMRRNSLKQSENSEMLREIRERSGLLRRLPPSGLRFPHQTFLEFFAALYLRERDQAEVFRLYHEDPQRWREVLLLYIGLSDKTEDTSRAVARLQESDTLEMTLSALSDARAVEPGIAEDILHNCRAALESQPEPELIVRLGYVASNVRTAHSELALEILRDLLRSAAESPRKFSPDVMETLLLASLRRPTEETSRFVVEHIEQLRLGRLLPEMGDQAFVLSTKIIGDPQLDESKKLEWIDGLRRAGAVKSLLELTTRPEIGPVFSDASAVALVRLSKSDEFTREVDAWTEQRNLDDEATQLALRRWGWPFESPSDEVAKRLMIHLAIRLAGQPESALEVESRQEVDPRILYLASGVRRERRIRVGVARVPAAVQATPLSVLRAIWKRSVGPLPVLRGDPVALAAVAISAAPMGVAVIWVFLSSGMRLFGGTNLALNWPMQIVILLAALVAALATYFFAPERGAERVFTVCLGVVLIPAVPLAILSQVYGERSLALTRMNTIVWLVVAVATSVFISEYTVVRIFFGAVVAAQAVVLDLCFRPGATHPVVENETTRELFRYLRGEKP